MNTQPHFVKARVMDFFHLPSKEQNVEDLNVLTNLWLQDRESRVRRAQRRARTVSAIVSLARMTVVSAMMLALSVAGFSVDQAWSQFIPSEELAIQKAVSPSFSKSRVTFPVVEKIPAAPTPVPIPSLTKFPNFSSLQEHAIQRGSVGVMVGFNAKDSANMKRVSTTILKQLANYRVSAVKQFRTIPYLALHIDAQGLEAIQEMVEVTSLHHDVFFAPTLATSTMITGARESWASKVTGAGQVVAILDTGVDASHPHLKGKVVEEACYSTSVPGEGVRSLCPNRQDFQMGQNAAAPGSSRLRHFEHGTHVADIAAGNGPNKGMAPDANIMAIQVYSEVDNVEDCDGETTCLRSFLSDQLRGMEQVYNLRKDYQIAAVNVSAGTGQYMETCDAEFPAMQAIVNLLKNANIPTVVGAGNDGESNALAAPACLSNVVSVGATTMTDQIADFSNVSQHLSLFAPGEWITAAVPGGKTEQLSGTSMAAAHASGAWALNKQGNPNATIDELLTHLRKNGTPVTGSDTPQIHLAQTLQVFEGASDDTSMEAPNMPVPLPPLASTASSIMTSSDGSGSEISDFWEFHWEHTLDSWTVGGSPSTTTETGVFRVTLGVPHVIAGETLHKVEVTGNAGTFAPRWAYLSVQDNRVLGSEDGVTRVTIFDAITGFWPGSGFFGTVPSTVLVTAAMGQIHPDNPYISGEAIVAGRSGGTSRCETIAGQLICAENSSQNFREDEFYRSTMGPVAYYRYSYYGDDYGYSRHTNHVGLIISSRLGHKLLSVEKDGVGTVTGLGINCGSDCEEAVMAGESHILTATGGVFTVFDHWTGCDGVSGNQCTVTVNNHHTVTATFVPRPQNQFSITSLPATDSDGTYTLSWDCTSSFCSSPVSIQEDSEPTFSSPDYYSSTGSSYTFHQETPGQYCYRVGSAGNWSEPACVTVDGVTLTVNVEGEGTVQGPGISCIKNVNKGSWGVGTPAYQVQNRRSDCFQKVLSGASVTLTAEPAAGWIFNRWEECNPSVANPCTVTMTANRTVTAVFIQDLRRNPFLRLQQLLRPNPSPTSNRALNANEQNAAGSGIGASSQSQALTGRLAIDTVPLPSRVTGGTSTKIGNPVQPMPKSCTVCGTTLPVPDKMPPVLLGR